MRTGHRLGLRFAQTVTHSSQRGHSLPHHLPLTQSPEQAFLLLLLLLLEAVLPSFGSDLRIQPVSPLLSSDSRLRFYLVTLPIASQEHGAVLNTQPFGTFNCTPHPGIKNAGHSDIHQRWEHPVLDSFLLWIYISKNMPCFFSCWCFYATNWGNPLAATGSL